MKYYYVYIVKCSDDSYYTGITNNIERRLFEHNGGINPKSYTYKRRPVKLVFLQEFTEPEMAIAKEKQIKKWTRRKKEALINGDYELLRELSKSKK